MKNCDWNQKEKLVKVSAPQRKQNLDEIEQEYDKILNKPQNSQRKHSQNVRMNRSWKIKDNKLMR